MSEATRSYWERALISAQATERDAAQTAEDRIYVEAARQAFEEAGLNPDQYVWRDGTRSFTAVIRGVAPDAIADDATMPTSFWTRRRVNEGVASLQTGAPASLNNFARMAAALGNDPNFAATLRRELNVIAVPIGGVIAWASATLPANFLRCDGAVYNIADAPLLFAVFGAHYGGDGVSTFAVPNLLDRTVVGAGNTWGLNAAGGTINHTLTVNEMPHHAHGVGDPAHAHALADPSHTHGVHDPGHGHGDPGHAHTIPLPGSFGFMWGAERPPEPAAQSRRASLYLSWQRDWSSRRRRRDMARPRDERSRSSPRSHRRRDPWRGRPVGAQQYAAVPGAQLHHKV